MKKEIIFYSTHCPRCRVIEMKLKQKNIEYVEENDVQKMLDVGLKSAPGLSIDGKVMDFAEAVVWINSQEA